MSPEPYLSAGQLAEQLGLSVAHVRRLTRERQIPHVELCGVVRYEPEQIAAWLASRRVAVEIKRPASGASGVMLSPEAKRFFARRGTGTVNGTAAGAQTQPTSVSA